jgi:antitoxin Phd
MMMALPELIPISDLRFKQNAILKRLADGPIVLTQRGRAAAVMLSPDAYNQLLADLEDYRDVRAIDEAIQEQGDEPLMAIEDFITELNDHASNQAV